MRRRSEIIGKAEPKILEKLPCPESICRKEPRRQHLLWSARGDARIQRMKAVSVRDLRYDFKKVERLLQEGSEIEITKRRKVIARLTPVRPQNPVLPDFLGRMRANYGNKVLEVSSADLVSADREDSS